MQSHVLKGIEENNRTGNFGYQAEVRFWWHGLKSISPIQGFEDQQFIFNLISKLLITQILNIVLDALFRAFFLYVKTASWLAI